MREMKDSGIRWIGEIPADWTMKRVKHIFTRKNEKAMQEDPIILSLARDGVKVRDISNNEGQIAESYCNYNPVDVGDLLLNPMDLYSGANCSISKVKGVISPAYINLMSKKGTSSSFYDYYFKVQYWVMAFFSYGRGVSYENRWTLSSETLMNYPVVALPYEEQCRIADYLDGKCAKIDAIVARQQELIEKLKAYKQSVITEAVTKGLDPHVPMKDSGIQWIGEIPKNWNVCRLKDYAHICNGRDYSVVIDENGDFPVIGSGGQFAKACKPLYQKESVLLGRKGTIDKPLFVDYPFWTVDTMYYTEIKEHVCAKFFYYLCTQIEFDFFQYGSALPSMTQRDLYSVNFPYPALNEQRRIADYLDGKCAKIDAMVARRQELIEKLKAYKKSLIYEVVTGKKEV